MPKPSADSASPPAITRATDARRASHGAAIDPATNTRPEGIVHSPACRGVSPSTSWKYCAMKRKYPNATNRVSTLHASAALNAGARNSAMSSSGWASCACRLTNSTPSTTPAAIAANARPCIPCSASRFMP